MRSIAVAEQWFYAKDGEPHGPIPWEQIRQLAASGQVRSTDLVWKKGMAGWVAASTTAGLLADSAAVADCATSAAQGATLGAEALRAAPPERWYYTQQGQRKGPVSAGELDQLVTSGQLQPTDLVWKKGMAQWVQVGQFPGEVTEHKAAEPWYYASASQRFGPVSRDEIERLLLEGQLQGDDLVWKKGMSNWVQVGASGLGLPAAAAVSSTPVRQPAQDQPTASPSASPSPVSATDPTELPSRSEPSRHLRQTFTWKRGAVGSIAIATVLFVAVVWSRGGSGDSAPKATAAKVNLAAASRHKTRSARRLHPKTTAKTLQQGNLDAATASPTTAIRTDAKDATALLTRGLSYYDQGDLDKAIADYTAAIRLDPHCGDALRAWGRAYCENGDLDKALADLDEAMRLDPKDAEALVIRGQVYYQQEDLDKAIREYTIAIGLDGNSAEAFRSRAIAYFDQDDIEKALADCNRAVQLDPEDEKAYACRALVYFARAEFDRALADCNEALHRDPEDVEVLYTRGRFYAREANWQLAIADFSEAIRLFPGYANAYDRRADAYQQVGQPDKAAADRGELERLQAR
jgi:tetratricopeptide (TPR) repeat protein